MKKSLVIVALVVLMPLSAWAQNVGACGWGSKLFHSQRGIAPQVLAVTTNGTSGNQTFAITSGTSGCTQDGVVRSNWKTAMFIDSNMNKFARDVSTGEGETLEAFASLIGMDEADKPLFYAVAKSNFESIFPSEGVSAVEVAASLKSIMQSNADLAKYSKVI